MTSLSAHCSIDFVERIQAVTHVSNGVTGVFIYVDDLAICGRLAENFRRLAARCSEAAAILEAANKPAPDLPSAEDVRGILKADEPGQSEGGVA